MRALALIAALLSASAAAQGLKLPDRSDGLDPAYARGWLAPDFDRFGFAYRQSWKDAVSFAPSRRTNWSYAVGERASFSMSFGSPAREFDYERQMSLYGRYWLSPDWAVSAESVSRDAGGLIRFNDFRIGIQRRF